MKKPKMSLGPDGVKGLFVKHVEKMVFGVAILLVLVFVFLGFGLESKLTGKSPPDLKQQAESAQSYIQRDTAAAVREERTPRDGKGGQYEVRVVSLGSLSPTSYETSIPWTTPTGNPGVKREDPEVFPPIKLETTALTGPLCQSNADKEEYAVALLENAPSKVKKKRTKRRRPSAGYGGYGSSSGEDEGEGGPGYGMGSGGSGAAGYSGSGDDPYGGGSRRGRKNRSKKDPPGPPRTYDASKVCGYRPSGLSTGGGYGGGYGGYGSGEGEDEGSGSGYGSGYGSSTGGSGSSMMPGSGEGDYGSGGYTGPSATSLPLSTTQHVIAVKALVPYRKQIDEFKRVLGEAVGFNPSRDTPRIIFFQAQRAVITDPDKELTEEDWKTVMNPKKAAQIANKEHWHGVMQEVADMTYVDPNVTMPAPPLMLRCLDDALLHSEVPKSTRVPTVTEPEKEEGDETEEPEADDNLPGGSNFPGGSRFPGRGFPGSGYPGGSAGYPGGSGYSGGSGMSGSGSGYGYGYGDGEGEGEGDSGYGYGMGSGSSGSGYGYGSGSGAGYGYGSGSGAGYGDGGYGGYGVPRVIEPVQYKLVRFFDTTVEPGKVYRYRIRLFVEDPNNPNTDPKNGMVRMPPSRRYLSAKVVARLKESETEDGGKAPYYVITDWSEASAPASLPSTSRAFVSEVSPARFSAGAGNIEYLTSEVSGTIAPVVWHDSLAIDVSKKAKAFRGTVLNMSGDFEILDPVTLNIKMLEDFDLASQFMVVDMLGGEDLPGVREVDGESVKVKSIGEFIMIDSQGNFAIHDELDDYERYRLYTLADEVLPASSSMGGYGGGDYGGSGEGDYEGSSGEGDYGEY